MAEMASTFVSLLASRTLPQGVAVVQTATTGPIEGQPLEGVPALCDEELDLPPWATSASSGLRPSSILSPTGSATCCATPSSTAGCAVTAIATNRCVLPLGGPTRPCQTSCGHA
jgi:hypothetical protein